MDSSGLEHLIYFEFALEAFAPVEEFNGTELISSHDEPVLAGSGTK